MYKSTHAVGVEWDTHVCDTLLAGGIAVTFVGHPFDTVKVRLQTQDFAKPIYCAYPPICLKDTSERLPLTGCVVQPVLLIVRRRQYNGKGCQACTRCLWR